METIKTIIHWSSYLYYLYVFGYASLFKIFQKESMMKSMESLGFNKIWTIYIGIGEFIGVLLIVIGLFNPPIKTIGILLLFPFAVGAFTAHMAHHEYNHFYNSLIMCILTVLLLWSDKNFKIIL
ncbi:DoxX family protein [Flavobacterium sp. 140616W15]|uniref:DoxX family protein n=1 Tax=Flavobacterium sp. 140616W15 TaxID=2478552 RepID=UPI000F0D0046|nr:DoxX family protein [Flavobacterium sp. 140616W15]AYN04358.1 DoxX family protein [Flavobacterium sp. 140616W15]